MRTVDLDLLHTMVAFADSGSCKAAAELIHRSQSAVSIKLKKLEEDVGATLFTRTGRSIGLNERGLDMVADARRILQINSELIERARAPGLTGVIRLGLPDDYVSLLGGFLGRLNGVFPQASLVVHCAPTAELKPMLERGELDIGILSFETDTKEGIVLERQPVHWFCSPGSDLHKDHPLPLALFPEGCFFRKWILASLKNLGRDYRIVCTSPNMAALQAVVRAGLAVSAFPRSGIAPGSRLLGLDEGFPELSDVIVMLCMSPLLRNDRHSFLARGVREMMQNPAVNSLV